MPCIRSERTRMLGLRTSGAYAYLSTAFRLLFLLPSVLGFDPEVSGDVVLFPACCTGFPGFTAGHGFDPAGGTPGGG
ncbi:hypothetical protein F511_18323 [Dorcoceras hygrometricum]|uniref:Uncharacterized protein n=1 Tax=Dorcoceras hygrometricum TaxID=472368 RepID=A0A2Z7CVM6_9LAMI|nr:hypothetical protein F511_18323 [Dorcoceras hygrometricum]